MKTRGILVAHLVTLVAACSAVPTLPNNAAVTSHEALASEVWGPCRDIVIVLRAAGAAGCPNRMHFAPVPVAMSPDGTMVGYFCACEVTSGNR